MPRLLLLTWLTLWVPALASADAPPDRETLTSQGRIVLTGTVGGMWSHELQPVFRPESVWMLRLEGAGLYCLRSRFCLGLNLSYAEGRAREEFAEGDGEEFAEGYSVERGGNDIAVGASALLDLPFHERFSLFVQPLLGWVMQSHVAALRSDSGQYSSYREGPEELYLQYLRTSVRMPLVVHLGSHWGLGLGPEVTIDILVASKDRSETFEGQSGPRFVQNNHARLQLGFALTVYGSL